MHYSCYYHEVADRNAETIDWIRQHVVDLVHPEVVYLLGLDERSRRIESLFTTSSATMRTIGHCYLLVLVNKKEDEYTLNCLQDKIETNLEKFIGATVIVLTLQTFNNWQQEGHPFAYGVKERAVCLYSRDGVVISDAREPDAEKLRTENEKLLKNTAVRVREFLAGADLFMMRKQHPMAAFMLHQAAEQALRTLMIVQTGYRFNCHSIDRLLRCCSMFCHQLPEIFPKTNEKNKRLFALLKDAYIGSRYKGDYNVSDVDIVLLREKVQRIVDLSRSAFVCGHPGSGAWLHQPLKTNYETPG